MQASRRTFIKQGTLALMGTTLLTRSLAYGGKKDKELTGMQLYCVRDDMKKDPLATLKQVAAAGYKHVEHASYVDRKFYGYPAAEFKKILSDLGMDMPSGHTVLRKDHWDEAKKDFTDAWKYTVDDAAVTGQQFVISPSLPKELRATLDDTLRTMELFNKAGEICKKSGMMFGYHNHDFEFSEKFGDNTLYDVIMEKTEPSLVMHQFDTGNLYNGGANAMEVMQKYKGRFKSMHVKDEILASSGNEKYESTILGKGIVPIRDIVNMGRETGTIHFIIEQEAYQGKAPIDCMKEDLEIMKSWGY